MTKAFSKNGVVGLGALGSAIDALLAGSKWPPRAVFFAVKAFDLHAAVVEHDKLWPQDIPFITLSNGYLDPVFQSLSQACPRRILRPGITTIGSTVKSDRTVEVFSAGSQTCWGPYPYNNTSPPNDDELKYLAVFPNASWQLDMRPMLAMKWLMNVVINSLCASHRLSSNSGLERFSEEVAETLREALELGRLLWPDVPSYPDFETARARVWTVIKNTGMNENSMVRDLRLGKRTESEFLAGVAEKYPGFPTLKSLHQKITARV